VNDLFSHLLSQHSTARGAVLGAIMGAAHPGSVPFTQDLCAFEFIEKEVDELLAMLD